MRFRWSGPWLDAVMPSRRETRRCHQTLPAEFIELSTRLALQEAEFSMLRAQLRYLPLVLALAAATGGCVHSTSYGGDPQLHLLDTAQLPAPERADYSAIARPYYIGPYDKLAIDVFGIEELSGREVQVDASGRISFPLIGLVDVNGKTPGEVETELAERLTLAHVRNPQVSVNIKEMVSRVVTVGGEVRMPGLYPVVGRMTLLAALAKAQGTTEFSKLDEVVVFRTVDGQRYAALYNISAIQHGQYPDPEIYASDVIMVDDSRSRRLFKDVLAILPALITPTVIAIDRLTR